MPPGKLADIDLRAALEAPVPTDIATVAQGRAMVALEALVKQLTHGSSEAAKVAAANAILDRGYGKPTAETGGELMLPFMQKPAQDVPGIDVRDLARRYATLAVEVLNKIASSGESESARVSAARALWDRGLGTVAPAKLADTLRPEDNRPMGKKEEMARAATAAATGRYAVPPPPSSTVN